MSIPFPIYRKYPNNKGYFKINSLDQFEELQIMGKYYALSTFDAKIHPDRMRIQDMIDTHNGHWEAIEMAEYETVLTNCQDSLQLMP